MILNSIKKAFIVKNKRNWQHIFFAVDIHDTILLADYKNTGKLQFFPYAKETLQLISKREDIVMSLFTCSYPEEIMRYQEFFIKNEIIFKYVNENLDVPNATLGCFDKKFYSNVIFDDKSGFDAKKEWKKIYEYFLYDDIKLKTFIEKANKVHGVRYNYDEVIFINAHTKIDIICPEHGIFKQIPNNHLNGSECPICMGKQKYSNESFIEKAQSIFGNNYDYSLVDYLHSRSKVKIICPEHGIFSIAPSNHINLLQGCPTCGIIKSRNSHLYETSEFISLANKVHKNKYDYSKSVYLKSKEKIIIICSEHGEFKQTPNSHLNGNGCPQCGQTNLSENKLYEFIKISFPDIKIERQKTFDWLNNKKTSPQFLDFYLPDYNIAIEYQGGQHFRPVAKFGGVIGLELTKERDLRKEFFCRINGIKIFYFSYENFICDDLIINENHLYKTLLNNMIK